VDWVPAVIPAYSVEVRIHGTDVQDLGCRGPDPYMGQGRVYFWLVEETGGTICPLHASVGGGVNEAPGSITQGYVAGR
jgi:uncharacterized Zn-finger protein